jgi:hypothetical protein
MRSVSRWRRPCWASCASTLEAGRHADVIVLTNGALAGPEDKGLVRRGRVPLAVTGFGLATRSDDVGPDISTPDALRAPPLAAGKVVLALGNPDARQPCRAAGLDAYQRAARMEGT